MPSSLIKDAKRPRDDLDQDIVFHPSIEASYATHVDVVRQVLHPAEPVDAKPPRFLHFYPSSLGMVITTEHGQTLHRCISQEELDRFNAVLDARIHPGLKQPPWGIGC